MDTATATPDHRHCWHMLDQSVPSLSTEICCWCGWRRFTAQRPARETELHGAHAPEMLRRRVGPSEFKWEGLP